MCGNWILGLVLLIISTVLFLLIYPIPTWIVLADSPRHESKQIIKMNLLWGWTLLGWIFSLVLACSGLRRYH